jgi:hypothetical protein
MHDVARKWARSVAVAPQKVAPCLAAANADAACLRSSFSSLLERAARHPAEDEAVTKVVDFYNQRKAADGAATALELTLVAIALSPELLFRTELGSGAPETTLTPYEVASALSYTLTDGPPDADLLAAARDGTLSDAAVVEKHARRLLQTPASGAGLKRFLVEHFELHRTALTSKDSQTYPEWTGAMALDFAEEQSRFLDDVVWSAQGGSFKALLKANTTFVNSRTAPVYGVQAPGTGWSRVTMPSERLGLLTQPGVLASHSQTNRSSIVFRGKFILERLLCIHLTPPPGIPALSTSQAVGRTQRERITSMTKGADCIGCHASLNELGFPYERFDGMGRARDTDDGHPIDSNATIPLDTPTPVDGAIQLASVLADSDKALACLAQEASHFVWGISLDREEDACRIQRLQEATRQSHGDLVQLFVAAVTDPTFVNRKTP